MKFATLGDALDAVAKSDRAVHYVAGESNERSVPYRELRACALGGVIAVPLAPGNADEHKAKFFRVLARLPSPLLATERKVFDRLCAFAIDNGLGQALS